MSLEIEFDLSFEDYLDARDEHPVTHNERSLSFYLPRMLLLLFGFFALKAWNLISAIILSSGLLLILAAVAIKHFVRRRAITKHKEELLRDF